MPSLPSSSLTLSKSSTRAAPTSPSNIAGSNSSASCPSSPASMGGCGVWRASWWIADGDKSEGPSGSAISWMESDSTPPMRSRLGSSALLPLVTVRSGEDLSSELFAPMLALVRTAEAGVKVKGVLGVNTGVRRTVGLFCRLVGVFSCSLYITPVPDIIRRGGYQ
ncbi:hypothetical protein FFLO_02429 [Filobasidium floriforme]|uniref:Uncharacterized protein n=1 Tax=Filobasidium floriforme TaxID=5210 RepID=A0A8K0JNB7_9TREE|nr:uncharacterized protein HD553DRAFT_64733 [Filobasidium floriforme]KAG7562147.1 hypothetical protein FFLO_02429 [Filobasidium floriforme]KAH8082712.1 hypothetical protein HD553DRAFT_64733 [Filobasidium floriforme]